MAVGDVAAAPPPPPPPAAAAPAPPAAPAPTAALPEAPTAQQQIIAASVKGLGDLSAGIGTAVSGANRPGNPNGTEGSRPAAERSEAGQPGPPPWIQQMMR